MDSKAQSQGNQSFEKRTRQGASQKSSETDPFLVQELNQLLANEYLLFTRTLNFHWNVVGPRFHSIHVFLEEQYKELLEMTDEVAERIRYLGSHPVSTLKEMRSEGSLAEDPGHFPNTTNMLAELCDCHEAINGQIQEVLEKDSAFETDMGTEDLLIQLQRKHQKMIWMLRSHLVAETDGGAAQPSRHN
ncbi:MAG TPA: DNA starvation/stationary phase protection protein [Pseudobdellovibrionaceae bacterium]|nr:DNA starvation/stationary phase protection protein [Pseudobdellovibrionaceae bacterium]